MWENPRPPYPNELCHHGIKGQTWGVRNGPPYPLDSQGKKDFAKNKKIKMTADDKKNLKGSRRTVENTAWNLYKNQRLAKTLGKKSDKLYEKSTKSEKHLQKYKDAKAKADDAQRRFNFWDKQYSKNLKDYTKKANDFGKRAKYDMSNRSVFKAANRSYRPGMISGDILLGPLGGGLGTAMNIKNIEKWGNQIERQAGFNPTEARDALRKLMISYERNGKSR